LNKLFCTFVRRRELEETVERITTTYPILHNKIFVLSITDRRDLAVTYTPDTTERLSISEDTILVHRKKHTNTLYTINAMNLIIKMNNNGVLDKTHQVDWESYKNSILLSNDDELNKLPTKVYKIISL
jgi:hypothetical protein